MIDIFTTFFWLGWISFGGPAAHIGYFRNHFVDKYQWLTDEEYAQFVALSQFLPGPGSSQVGFAIGYKRGGVIGGCMAFLGFTLPSIIIMLSLAALSSQFTDTNLFESIVHGLKLLAVIVVADAAWGMYKTFCTNKITVSLCLLTAVILLVLPHTITQIFAITISGMVGYWFLSKPNQMEHKKVQVSYAPAVLFVAILFGLPFITSSIPFLAIFSDFFQAGSLVFGGGHVVLPLLQNLLGAQIEQNTFLTGYAAAQAVPGPMFTLATYLGYFLYPSAPIFGALLATLGVFLPGFLLLMTVMSHWQAIAQKPKVTAVLTGVNAAVVGLLVAALYQPVFVNAVLTSSDLAGVLIGVLLWKQLKLPILWLVIFFILFGIFTGELTNALV